MNERWNELIKQAIQEVGFESRSDKEETLKRYAELIVKDCLETANRIKNDPLTHLASHYKIQYGNTQLHNTTVKEWIIAAVEDIERDIRKKFGVDNERSE